MLSKSLLLKSVASVKSVESEEEGQEESENSQEQRIRRKMNNTVMSSRKDSSFKSSWHRKSVLVGTMKTEQTLGAQSLSGVDPYEDSFEMIPKKRVKKQTPEWSARDPLISDLDRHIGDEPGNKQSRRESEIRKKSLQKKKKKTQSTSSCCSKEQKCVIF